MTADTGLTAEAYTLRGPRGASMGVLCVVLMRPRNKLSTLTDYVRDKNIRKMTSSFLLGWHLPVQCSVFFVCLFFEGFVLLFIFL